MLEKKEDLRSEKKEESHLRPREEGEDIFFILCLFGAEDGIPQ